MKYFHNLFADRSDFIMKKVFAILCFVVFTLNALTMVRAEEDEEEEEKENDVGTVVGIDLGTTYSW